MKCLSLLVALPLGAFVTIIGMAVALGGLKNALEIIGLSIVCTAGIGLVIWIPVWWGIGGLCVMIITAIVERKSPSKTQDSPTISHQKTPRDVQAVKLFISMARSNGLSEEDIDQKLKSVGWSSAVIDSARFELR